MLSRADLVVMLFDLAAMRAMAPSISERMSCAVSSGGTGK